MDINNLKGLMEAYKQVNAPQEVDEATAMAKRGYDEAPIRQKIAKTTGGGEAADRASALEKKSTFGDAKKAKQRTDYARKQRGDFRKTTSSSPGLHVGQHKSDDSGVKAKQAARGAQRGALTPAEKKQFNREEFDIFDIVLEFLQAEGFAETLEEAKWIMANELDEGMRTAIGNKVKKHVNQYAYQQGIHNNPGWLRKPEKRAALNKAVRDDIKKNPKSAVKYVGQQVKKKLTNRQPKTGITGTVESLEFDIFDLVLEFLQVEGFAETLEEAKWIMANELDGEAIAIIAEAMEEDDEDEKEIKKGKKSKKSEEDDEDEEDDEEELEEASYSAKAARAGKDIGKPGKAFAKIAKSAAKRYGSKERGEKVAGAVLTKLRAKRG